MLPAKYQPNRPVGSGGHLEFQIMTYFSLILYIYHINAKYEIS